MGDSAPFDGAGAGTGHASTEYAIRGTPDLQVISPGACIRYTCDWKAPGRPPEVAGAGFWGPRDGIRWYTYGARRPNGFFQRQVRQGPLQAHWDLTWDDGPGQYTVIAEIRSRVDNRETPPTYCFRPQQIGDAAALLDDWLDKLTRTGDGPSPAQAEREIARYRALLNDVARRFPPRDPVEHKQQVDKWADLAGRLRRLLAPSDGRRRIPVRGIHLETLTQAQRPLLLFLTELRDAELDAELEAGQRPSQRWSLVDWTDAGDPRFRGNHAGEGATAGEAIAACLASWDWGNRYPAGHVRFEVPPEVRSIVGGATHRQMATNGTSLGDEVVALFEWIAVGSMLIAGFCFIFVAVPTWTSLAMGTSMLASTAGAVFGVAQRWRDGLFDWKADAIDGLTIVGNLIGAGAWARGARVRLPGGGAGALDFVFLGARVGTDAAQGILVAASRVSDLDALMKDPTLQPEERARKLLALLVELTAVGLMTAVSFRGSSREAATLSAKPVHLQGDPRATVPDDLLNRLTQADGPPIDATRAPIAEGHTATPQQKTRLQTGIAPAPRTLKPRETELAKAYRKDAHPWVKNKLSRNEIFLMDEDGFQFHAECRDGTLAITILTVHDPGQTPQFNARFGPRFKKSKVLRARELYPRMYKYFEQVGNEVTALEGGWAWTNYNDAKAKYDELVSTGMRRNAAAKIAVTHARTYVKYHEPMGFTRVVSASHIADAKLFTFRMERE